MASGRKSFHSYKSLQLPVTSSFPWPILIQEVITAISWHISLPCWFPYIPVEAFHLVQFSSLSCLTLCNPMDCSTPGFPVHHQLPELAQTHVCLVSDAIQPSHPLSTPSPPAFNLSQHQGLFQWISSLNQVDKVLEVQLHYQSFQWIFRTDFLQDWVVWSPCSPRDSQESSPTPQFKSINSSAMI